MAVIFNKISLNGAKLEKSEMKTFHFGDRIRTLTVIWKKKSSRCVLLLVVYLSSYHEKAINALYELA